MRSFGVAFRVLPRPNFFQCKLGFHLWEGRRHLPPESLLQATMSYSGRGRYDSYSPPRGNRSLSMSYSRSRSRSRSRDSGDVANPGNNLYVTGLSPRITKRDLEDHFSREGKVVECHLVVDPRTRESRGFGFVTMATSEDADRCIKYLNRSVLEGRVITVEKQGSCVASSTLFQLKQLQLFLNLRA